MSLPVDDPALKAALDRAPAIRFDGNAFRAMPGGDAILNAGFEHLWAGTSAGRCNPAGVFRLHLSVEKKTAQAEFRYYAGRGGLEPDLAETYEFAAKVKLARVLDLMDGHVRRGLGITREQILADWEPDPLLPPPPPTRLQAIGYWISLGHGNFSAILYPARWRSTGRNLVIFKDRLGLSDSVVPLSKRPTKSWP